MRGQNKVGQAREELRRWLDRFLPPVCVVCGDPLARRRGRVYDLCWARAPGLRPPRCGRCGISLHDIGIKQLTSSCTECGDWLPYLREARAPFRMDGSAAAIVRALKYGGWEDLAGEMASRMAPTRFSREVESEISGVVAVPLSRTRLRERGYNQAELLAREVASRRALPLLDEGLQRTRHTERQTRLTPAERSANVADAFSVPRNAHDAVQDAHLLLVDDVLTTAATVQECVRALCSAGARAVSVLSFARARPELAAEATRSPGGALSGKATEQ